MKEFNIEVRGSILENSFSITNMAIIGVFYKFNIDEHRYIPKTFSTQPGKPLENEISCV